MQEQAGELVDAEKFYRLELAIDTKRVAQSPNNLSALADLKHDYNRLGFVSVLQTRIAAAKDCYLQAREVGEKIVAAQPTFENWWNLAWAHILVGEFPPAKEAALSAVRLAPADNIGPQVNLAHAQMFLGEKGEAEAIHRKYKDQKLANGASWVGTIQEDFIQLRRLGLEHPQMKDIEQLLGIEAGK